MKGEMTKKRFLNKKLSKKIKKKGGDKKNYELRIGIRRGYAKTWGSDGAIATQAKNS
jgi:hypothetical protein